MDTDGSEDVHDGLLGDHRLEADPVTVAAFRELSVGSRTLYALSDGFILMNPDAVGTPAHPSAAYDALAKEFDEPRFPIGCFVWPGERNALVDAGFGARTYGQELVGGNLEAALDKVGFGVDQIHDVTLSHLHLDHAAGIAHPVTGEPIFPNAVIHVGAADWDFFVEGSGGNFPIDPTFRSALISFRRDGRVALVESDATIVPGLDHVRSPGHTPGHAIHIVKDSGHRVVLLGDAMHCAQQLANPEWGSVFDEDPELACIGRQQIAQDLARNGGLAIGCHFPRLSPATASERSTA